MLGCFKVFNAKRTYDVTKPTKSVPEARQSNDSSHREAPPRRRDTGHSIQLPRPPVEEDEDILQSASGTNPEEQISNKPSAEAHLKTNGDLIANETKVEIQNAENEPTRTINQEGEVISKGGSEKVDNENEQNREISRESQIESVEVETVTERLTTANSSESVIVETTVEAIPSASSNDSNKLETNHRNEETIPLHEPSKEIEHSHEPVATNVQSETISEVKGDTKDSAEQNNVTERVLVHEQTINLSGNDFVGTDQNQTQIIPVGHQQVQHATIGAVHGNVTQQDQIEVIPLGPQQTQHEMFATTSNQNVLIVQGNVTHQDQTMIASTSKQNIGVVYGNVVQSGSAMNMTNQVLSNEVESNEVSVEKPKGVKFIEDEIIVYSSSDEGSYDGVGDDAGIPKERREGFREAVKIDGEQDIKTHPKSEQEALEIKKAFLANEFLQTVLREDQLNTLVDAMYLREVEENEVIIQEGEPGNHMYVSAGGTFDVYVNQKKVNSFSDFRVFGELAILYNAKRMATIKSTTTGRIWVLHRSIYQRILVQDAIREYDEKVSFLQNVPIISTMKLEKLRKIANLLRKDFFKSDTVIVHQGDVGDKFYIIRAGSVTVTKKDEGKVAELSKGAYFGERALLQEDCRQATVTADPPGVECLTLTRTEFKEHFDDDYFSQSSGDHSTQSQIGTEPKEPGEFAEIQLDDLKRVETLGVGGFGRVELVQHKKQANLTFALKYLKKVDMVQQGQVDHVFNEKNIQITCNSVFVVRMYKTFSDNKYLYFLMESCLGGDLWTYLQRQKGRHVGDNAARFFAGCVLEALTYLHDRDYIYRDLKPENLIIDNSGYIKLTDFGFAKYVGRNGRTFTFAGTPEYVAPEIVYNRGHDKAVDYWAFGIFIFELLVGKTPFRSDDPSHMRTYNRILKGINSVQFPASVSRPAVLIIQKLCKAIPTERLGCQKNGAQDIRNHKWFQPLDWNKLRNRKVKAPFAPKLQTSTDTKYFERFKPDDDVPPDELEGFDDFES